jgi:CzcA family heavy metal efflux pump
MLRSIVDFSIRFKGIVIALTLVSAGYGIFSLFNARLDVYPEFAPPSAGVQTEAPGLSSEQVETLVTQPIENRLSGAAGLESMRSTSLQGLSSITLTFGAGTDIYRARQLVAEQLNAATRGLPQGIEPPVLLPLSSSTGVVLVAGLTSQVRSQIDLYKLAEWTIKPRLLGLSGVADVVVFGGDVPQFQVRARPDALLRYGLSMQDLLTAVSNATGVRGTGFIENTNQRFVLNAEGQSLTPSELAQTLVTYKNGIGIRVRDVADVVVAPAPPIGAATINGRQGVMLIVEGQYGSDPMAVTQSVEKALKDITPAMTAQHVTIVPDIFCPTNFIDIVIDHLRTALLLGGLLVVAILFLFMRNYRLAAISATAIPLSLLAAIAVLTHLGLSLNVMTLGGLAIAIGEVVDDAIVDVENIYRRLRENRTLANPRPTARVVLDASLEVRSAVVFATYIVALVFMPIFFLTGVVGKLFSPLALAYILAILASLGTALVVTPALACLLIPQDSLEQREPRFVSRMRAAYRRLLECVERRSRLVIGCVAGSAIAALICLPFFQGNFIPNLKEGHYTIHMTLASGTSLAESVQIGNRISAALLKVSGVRLIAQRAGRADEISDPADVNHSEFELDLVPGADQVATLNRVKAVLATIPGVSTSVNGFLRERIDESISGVTSPVTISIFGDNLDILDEQAKRIVALVNAIPGASGVSMQTPRGTPQLDIRLQKDELARFGLEPVDVLNTVAAANQGTVVTQIYDGNRVYDVSVMLDPTSHRRPDQLRTIPLRNARGETVFLGQVADIQYVNGRASIQHTGGQRSQTVTASVVGRPISAFVTDVQNQIRSKLNLPAGVYVSVGGEAAARAEAARNLLVNTAVAGIGIFLMLFLALRSGRSLLLVLANLPFALIGGVGAVLLTGGGLELGAMVGFVTLFGITLRNSIMLISHYQHLVSYESATWDFQTAIRGASERLLPIVMTALVTAAGLLPLAVFANEPGNELEGPLAIVILGGLITSTVLNLIVLPVLALRFGKFEG